jgi:hypothetical protein
MKAWSLSGNRNATLYRQKRARIKLPKIQLGQRKEKGGNRSSAIDN